MEELQIPENLLQFCGIPFRFVPTSLRVWLGLHLNPERNSLAPTTGNLQDWRGVAEVLEFSPLEIINFQRSNDPFGEVMKNLKITKQDPTVGEIMRAILECERHDILENPKLLEYLNKVKPSDVQLKIENDQLQDPSVDSCSGYEGCLTVGEADTGVPEYFNAFVCYNPVDIGFVKNMRIELEEKLHLKLFIPERDFLAGPSKYEAITKLIQERCDKFIVVLSPDFMNSEECNFMLNFAHSLNPNARKKKVIPILYKRCEIPMTLSFTSLVDYTRDDVIDWFWNRLEKSLKAPKYVNNVSPYMTQKAASQIDPRSPNQETIRLKTTKAFDDFLEIRCYQSSASINNNNNNNDEDDDKNIKARQEARGPSPIDDFIDVSTEISSMPMNFVPPNKSFSFTQRFKFP